MTVTCKDLDCTEESCTDINADFGLVADRSSTVLSFQLHLVVPWASKNEN